ncbi:MAG: O-antigen ligase family protein [Nitrososphaeraceae archaeon]
MINKQFIIILVATVLIIIVIYKDIIKYPNVSIGQFLPLIWMLYASSRPLYYWFTSTPNYSGGDISALEGSPIDRIFLTFLIFAGMFVLYRRRDATIDLIKNNGVLITFFVYIFISILWSDYLYISFKRAFRTFGDLVMALIVATEISQVDAINRLIKRNTIVIITISVVLIKYYPEIAVLYTKDEGYKMYIGVTTHKSDLGAIAMVSGIWLIYNILINWCNNKRQEIIDFVLLLMVIWILHGPISSIGRSSLSQVGIIGTYIGFVILIISIYFRNNPRIIEKYLIGGSLLILFTNFAFEVFTGTTLLEKLVLLSGREMTFTGRTWVWNELVKVGLKNPFFGCGFGGFWVNITNIDFPFSTGHNGYLDVFVDLGLVGLLLLTIIIIIAYSDIRSIILNHFDLGLIRLVFIITIIITNFIESTFIKPSSLLWYLFIIISIRGSRIKEEDSINNDWYMVNT